jgi:hypothetical protein
VLLYVFFVLLYVFFVLLYVFFVLLYAFFCCSMYFFVVLCDVCFVTFPVLFVCICVLNNCHRVATQLQLNISYHIVSYHIIYHIISYHIISYHIISYHIISYHISYHIISYHINFTFYLRMSIWCKWNINSDLLILVPVFLKNYALKMTSKWKYLSLSNDIVYLANRHDIDVRKDRQVKEVNSTTIRVKGGEKISSKSKS